MSENSIKFSLSNSEQRDSWLNSGHRTLDADIYSIQYNLVNELMTCQGHGHLVINNHIQELQESFVYTNQFTSLPQVKPTVPLKENKEEKEKVILI